MAMDRPLLAVPNWNDGGQLLMYNVSCSGVSGSVVVPSARDDDDDSDVDEPMIVMREMPCSFAGHKCCALAISGSTILGLTYSFRDIVVYDTAVAMAAAPGPRLHHSQQASPAMLPVGDDTVVVMSTILDGYGGSSFFEALRRDGGGVWRAFPLPEPPVGIERGRTERVSAYLALGTRLWISVTRKGTFSLDVHVHGGCWKKEGRWELPLYNRAMFVQELGSVIGITINSGGITNDHGGSYLCALDMEVRPPVLRHVWEETYPSECLQAGHVPWQDMMSLAYLGDGAFCVCRPVNVERDPRDSGFTRNAISLMAVQLKRRRRRCLPAGNSSGSIPTEEDDGRELQLARRGKVRYHTASGSGASHSLGLFSPS